MQGFPGWSTGLWKLWSLPPLPGSCLVTLRVLFCCLLLCSSSFTLAALIFLFSDVFLCNFNSMFENLSFPVWLHFLDSVRHFLSS